MITLHFKLTFENEKDKKQLINLMREFSSCYKYTYNRLLEGHKRKELKKHLQKIFNLNSRYYDDAIFKAQTLINSCKERGQNPKKVIFGGKKLFEKLNKKHLNRILRKRLHQWIYKGLLEKIKAIAKREGIEVIKINSAYTSIVGALKYVPQYSLDKDTAGAFIIGRKALKFKEKLPKNYEKLIKKKINKLKKQINSLKSLCSEPQTQEAVNLWKEQMRDLSIWTSYKLWQIVKVALAIPVLGKTLNRDLSPLKPILVKGDWDRVVSRLVPISWGRGYGVDKYRQLGRCPHLKKAE